MTYGRRIPCGTSVARCQAQRVTWFGARRRVMSFLMRLRTLVRQDEGQDLLEYALLVALIALVAVAAVTAAGASEHDLLEHRRGARQSGVATASSERSGRPAAATPPRSEEHT